MDIEIKTPPSNVAFRDGYERIWGQGIPEMNDEVRNMLSEWLETKSYSSIVYFFMGTCDYSEDYSHFLLRELIRDDCGRKHA